MSSISLNEKEHLGQRAPQLRGIFRSPNLQAVHAQRREIWQALRCGKAGLCFCCGFPVS